MFARVTLFEIDTMRISMDAALARFTELVLPALRSQTGYQGVYVLQTPEGRGLLMSLWETEEAAKAGVASGYYEEQVGKFIMLTRQPPGRDHYEVTLVDTAGGPKEPAASAGRSE